jgi:UPF0755 protein
MPSEDFWHDTPVEKQSKAKTKKESLVEIEIESAPIVKKKLDLEPSTTTKNQPKPTKKTAWLKTIIIYVVLIILGAAIGIGLLLFEGLSAKADVAQTEPIMFNIVKGESSQTVARDMEHQDIIVSQYPFLMYLKIKNLKLRTGVYALSPNSTTTQIADQVAAGDVTENRVTIPEGWRLEQIANLLDQDGIVTRADFLAAAKYDPVRYTLPTGATLKAGDALEGYLFPDTYDFTYGETSKDIVQAMLDDYSTRTATLKPTYAQLILASIVEREAKFDVDRPKIAGVYTNRLKNNMKLDADPTVQYGKDSALAKAATDPAKYTYWTAITAAEYQSVQSTFNTYLNLGLPPAPICNPGLKSIEAAVNPTVSTDFFFFNLSDGTTIYSATQAQHDANKKKYGL